MKQGVLLLLAILGSLASLRADDSNGIIPSPLPPGPLCNHVPLQAECRITFVYGSSAPAATTGGPDAKPIPLVQLGQMPPAGIVIRRSGSIWHGTLTDTVGRVTECWSDGLTNFVITPDSPQPNPTAQDGMVMFSEFLNFNEMTILPGFNWVSPANYRGIQTIVGSSCLVFQLGDTTVWVDAGSRLPVQWVRGNETRKIVFNSSFQTQVVLPPEIAAMARGIAVSRANNNRKPPRGG